MSYMKKMILLITGVFVLAGCQQDQPEQGNGKITKVNLQQYSIEFNRKHLSYLTLKEPDSLLISHIDKLILRDSLFFVADVMSAERILVFDFDGNFMYGLDKKGDDPESYIQLVDFDVERSAGNDRIHVLTPGRMVKVYEKSNWVDSYRISYNADEILANKNKTIFKLARFASESDSTNSRKAILVCDRQSTAEKIIGKNEAPTSAPPFLSNSLAGTNTKFAFSAPFSKLITIYNDENLEKEIEIGWPMKELSPKFFERRFSNPMEQLQAFNKEEGYHHMPDLHLDESLLLSHLLGKDGRKYFEVNLKTREGFVWDNILFNKRAISDLTLLTVKEGYLYFHSTQLQSQLVAEQGLETRIIFYYPMAEIIKSSLQQ
jgi:hypothetical protein